MLAYKYQLFLYEGIGIILFYRKIWPWIFDSSFYLKKIADLGFQAIWNKKYIK